MLPQWHKVRDLLFKKEKKRKEEELEIFQVLE